MGQGTAGVPDWGKKAANDVKLCRRGFFLGWETMTVGATTTVKCPACGKFAARISGTTAEVVFNCKTRDCGCELKVTYDNGAVSVSIVGKSNVYTPAKR